MEEGNWLDWFLERILTVITVITVIISIPMAVLLGILFGTIGLTQDEFDKLIETLKLLGIPFAP